MSALRYGSLFSGYGGLELGVQSVLGGSTAWHCEIDKAPSKILAHHWPDTPNLGDITQIDWRELAEKYDPVDVLCGGFPCQDVSQAGKRLGLKPGTRSGLWSHMAYAIDQLRPRLVVAENVRGLLSASAASDLEPCPWCLGDGERSPLRALGAVLGDLADLGYDADWYGIRASDAGAPHGRFRVFVFAADTRGEALGLGPGLRPSGPARLGRGRPDHGRSPVAAADPDRGRREVQREPEPLGVERASGRVADGRLTARELDDAASIEWGDYGPAVRRWERVSGLVAPSPTEVGKHGARRLSPAFVEWMMGLPAGHVTAVSGLSRTEQLKPLGNGVVPQQAALATRLWLASQASEVAA